MAFFVLVVVYVLFGFFGAPPIIRSQAEKRLSAELNRPVKILQVRFNPLTLSLEITGLHVGDGQGGEFVGWQRLFVNFDPLKRLFGAWTFKEIDLVGFNAAILRDATGRMNFADLIEKARASPPSTDKKKRRPPALAIERLGVSGARIQFKDASQSTPFSTDVGPVTFTLLHLRTTGDAKAPHSFSAATETGETLTWQGTLELEPLKSVGEFTLTNLPLAKYAPYYQDYVGFALRNGLLGAKGRYEAELTEGAPQARLSDGSLTLQRLELTARDAQNPRVTLNEIAVTGIQADLGKREGTIERVLLTGGNVFADRTPDGTIDLVTLLSPRSPAPAPSSLTPAVAPSSATSTSGGTTANPWSFTLNEAAVEEFALAFTDRALKKPAVLGVVGLTAKITSVKSRALNEPSTVEMKFGLKGGGEVSANGTLALQPLGGKLALALTQLPLALANPYVQSALPLHIEKGAVTLTGDVTLADGGITFAGQTHLDDFALLDDGSREPVAGWSSLAIEGVQASSQPLKADIAAITWRNLSAHAIIEKDGKLNLASFGGGAQTKPNVPDESPVPAADTPDASPPARESPVAPPSDKKPLPPISVGKITFEQARFTFRDHSVQPAAESELSKLSGTIEGLSSTQLGRGDLQLKGVINETAPVEITGKLNPLGTPPSADVKLDFKGIELSPLAPYVAKYAGYALERGALTLAVEFKLNNRSIDSSDVITLDQFALGEKNESPDALKMPITLAIALLKDRSGRIVIDVPIQGSLDDPNFRIGRVVMRVIGNLLAKAATSPFALLGSMFGGGGDDLAFQAFAAGEVTPLESEAKKLETVTKALANRPALRLDLAGSYDPVADRAALQRMELEHQIRARALENRPSQAGSATPASADGEIVITDEERARILSSLHAAAFPELAPPTPPPVAETAASAPPARPADSDGGILKRVRRLFSHNDQNPSQTAPSPATPASSDPEEKPASSPQTPALNVEEMTAHLIEKITIDDETLRRLATTRAQRIRAQLLQSGDVAPERVFVVAPVATGSRVELRLK